ncbi:NAD-dependent epimerase/dehydratase family protein [Rhodoligotrophos defluvii]|uniref:NAD-dependent epimerase/dehydratase family protein n=1 Tax=Rhodoligotrophos defluvii TaxID=2561934 RepID=UPI0010C9BC33|nr:NAD(P)-dependent oxidoreductase [Rhodoligotrophos defluvii]
MNAMRVFVVGGTGVIGRQLMPRLVERGHKVVALVLEGEAAGWLSQLGIECAVGNILSPADLRAPLRSCDAAIHVATAVPRPGQPVDWTLNDRIRTEGTANLLNACRDLGVERYIQQGVVHLTADGTDQLRDEDAPPHPTRATESSIEMERLVKESGLGWTILRGGILYGPHAGQDEAWRAAARDGSLSLPGDGRGFISLIHVVDYARAVITALEHEPKRTVFNVVDDEPVPYATLFQHIAAVERGPSPKPGGAVVWASCRASNSRMRETFGWSPVYATYRSGWS